MWRRKVFLGVQPIAHEGGFELRIPVRGYQVRLERVNVVYDEVRAPQVKPSAPRPKHSRRA